jgi:uncharacterized protein (TIGR02246 family)
MGANLAKANQIWNQAWFDKDAATVERMMADDYVYVAPNGQVMDRATILEIIRSPGYRIEHGTHTDVVIRELGPDAAVIRHHWQGEGTFAGTRFKDDQQCLQVLVRQDGQWRVVLDQSTAKAF